MTTKNIQDVVAERVEELFQYYDDIDCAVTVDQRITAKEQAALWLERTLTQLVKEVETGERVLVFQPQWVDKEPAWLCVLIKNNEVLAEKVYKQSELGSAYWQETGNYPSTVITVEQTNIGAKRLLHPLTPPTSDETLQDNK